MSGSPPARSPWPTLLALMAIGLVARLINVASGLWFDEIVTLVKYVRAPVQELLTSCTDFNNHMLFTLAAKVSVALFGESAWALRLPAVLFGVAAIPALWWFASRVVGRREALLAAALLTVSYHHVWFSQNARGYTGLMFWNLLGSTFFLDGMRKPSRRAWIAYGLVSAAGVWINLTAAFAIAAHGLVYLGVLVRGLIARRRGLAPSHPGAPGRWPLIGFLIACGLGLALYSAILPEMMQEFGRQSGLASANVKVRAWTSPLWTLQEALRQTGLGPGALVALALGGLLALVGFVSIVRRDVVAAAIMVLPAPVTLVVLLLIEFHVWPRYFFPLFGFAFMFIVRGIWVASAALAGAAAARVATAAAVLLVIASAFMLPADWRLPKQDYEGARDFVRAERKPAEPIVTVGLASTAYAWLYAPDWTPVDDVAALDRVTAGAPRTWLVYSFPTVLATSHPEVVERARARFELVREFPGTVGDGTVSVLRSR